VPDLGGFAAANAMLSSPLEPRPSLQQSKQHRSSRSFLPWRETRSVATSSRVWRGPAATPQGCRFAGAHLAGWARRLFRCDNGARTGTISPSPLNARPKCVPAPGMYWPLNAFCAAGRSKREHHLHLPTYEVGKRGLSAEIRDIAMEWPSQRAF